MNFKWQNDIYNDNGYRSNDTRNGKHGQPTDLLLPRSFKIIGLAIAFAPVVLKIMQLFYANALVNSIHLRDRYLLLIMVAGLGIEAMSKCKRETYETFTQREKALIAFLCIAAVYLVPLIASGVTVFWHNVWAD
jgi:hypothetical protein